jgi:hypothetical protein
VIYLVGESNPHSEDPEFALYPAPKGSSGERLCKVLGMDPKEYLRTFERRNLLQGDKWDAAEAAKTARGILLESKGAPIVMLGRRVGQAFGLEDVPFFDAYPMGGGSLAVLLPHPSGRNREWNAADCQARARAVVGILLSWVGK